MDDFSAIRRLRQSRQQSRQDRDFTPKTISNTNSKTSLISLSVIDLEDCSFQCLFTKTKNRGEQPVISVQFNIYLSETSEISLAALIHHANTLNQQMSGLWVSVRADQKGCYYLSLQGSSQGPMVASHFDYFLTLLARSLSGFWRYTQAHHILLQTLPRAARNRYQQNHSKQGSPGDFPTPDLASAVGELG